MCAVGVQSGSQNARFFRCLKNDGSGTVAKQHAGAAVIPIENTRKDFGAHDQCPLVRAGLDEFLRDRKRVNEAAANSLDVEGRCAFIAEFSCSRQAVLGKTKSGSRWRR